MLNQLNRQILPLLAGVVLLGAPLFAQSVQANGMEGGGFPRMERAFKDLNLTDAQKAQMKVLRESARNEMQQILTADQKAILAAAKKEGKKGDRRAIMKSLNLTDAQKAQMKTLRQQQRAKVEAILTPEQKAKLEQKRAQMKARFGDRMPGL